MFKNLKNKELLLSFIVGIFLVSILGFSLKAQVYPAEASGVARALDVLSPIKAASDAARNVSDVFKITREKIDSFFKNLFSPVQTQTDVGINNNEEPLPVSDGAQAYEDQIVRVVEKGAPSVVSIIVSKDLPVFEQYYVNPFEDFGFDVPENFGIPQLRQKGMQKQEIGGGSGFVISQDGLIATNKHVASDLQAEYTVILNDGTKLSAKIIARDPNFDLAILKVEKSGLVPLPLGDSSKLKLGRGVIAIGNALGEFKNTVSTGVISGLDRSVDVDNETLTGLIQTDAAINKGNSGGPLLNLAGEVIGINTAMALDAENIGFAIPINQVKKIIKSVEQNGILKVAYLGVRYQIIGQELKNSKKLPVDYGALIASGENDPGVVPDSPASTAGLKEGDIILELNGEKITGNNTLVTVLRNYSPGDKVSLKILRNGKEMSLEATLGER